MTATTVELKEHLSDYLSRVQYGGERITITRNGKPVAALISLEDPELLRAIEDRIDLAEARKALAEAENEATVSWGQVNADEDVEQGERGA